MRNQLYTVTYDLDWLKPAKIVPSKHFVSLSLEDQTAALKSRIETLYEDLKQLGETSITHDVGMRETVKRRRELITEIELSEQYLAICQERHGGPSTSEKVNEFSSAAQGFKPILAALSSRTDCLSTPRPLNDARYL